MTLNSKRPSRPKLTPSEKACLEAFREVRRKLRPIAPTVQEVANQMGQSKGNAGLLLKALERKGYVTRKGRAARSLSLAKAELPTDTDIRSSDLPGQLT